MPTSASYNFPLHWSFTKVFAFFTSHVSSKLVDRSFHKSNFHNVGKQSLFCNQQKQTDQRSTIPFEKKVTLINEVRSTNCVDHRSIQRLHSDPFSWPLTVGSEFLLSLTFDWKSTKIFSIDFCYLWKEIWGIFAVWKIRGENLENCPFDQGIVPALYATASTGFLLLIQNFFRNWVFETVPWTKTDYMIKWIFAPLIGFSMIITSAGFKFDID